MMVLFILVRLVVFVLGGVIVIGTFVSALRNFVLPRSAPDGISRTVFMWMRQLFELRKNRLHSFLEQDRAMELYAPLSLIMLLVAWLGCIAIGYMGMYWALNTQSWYEAFKISGSSLLTLGFSLVDNFPTTILAFSEATIGLILIALLIAYLPTIYAAFQRREAAVTMLEVRAGSPPSAVEMIKRYSRLKRLDQLGELWTSWEVWFVDIEESHTSAAWRDFVGWRVNYDTVLLALAELVMAPSAPWSSDRELENASRPMLRLRKGRRPVEKHEWIPPSNT